jgi:hypothetical protein
MTKIYCVVCAKQAVNRRVSRYDELVTTLQGAKAAVNPYECYCGYCAEDLDENGLFPEDRSLPDNE